MSEATFNSVEDRVRAATRSLAGTWPATDVPALRLPEAAPGRGWLDRRPRVSRVLAPAAAAAAIVALAVSLVSLGGAMHAGRPGATAGNPAGPGLQSGPGQQFGPVAAGAPAAQLVAAGTVPPYFVQITANGNPNFMPSYAVVRATATGTILGTVPASQRGYTVLAATAAADDRTFVLDEEKWADDRQPGVNSSYQLRSFYLLRLGADGVPASVTRLPMTAGRLVTGVALSPDGTRLAIAVQPQDTGDPSLTEVRVFTLATGEVRTWSGDGTIGGAPDDASSISWTADGQLLFEWAAGNLKDGTTVGTRLLDLARPGSSLIGSSRWITVRTFKTGKRIDFSALSCNGGIVTPDGSGVVCAAVATFNDKITGHSLHRDANVAFFRYSTATGKLSAVIARWTIKNAGALTADVLWTNASGSVIIGAIPNTADGRVGIISDGRFSQLPGGSFYGVW